jgi:hypothetical protein
LEKAACGVRPRDRGVSEIISPDFAGERLVVPMRRNVLPPWRLRLFELVFPARIA